MQPNKLVAGIVRRMPAGESVHTVGGVTARMTAAPHVVYLARRTTVGFAVHSRNTRLRCTPADVIHSDTASLVSLMTPIGR
jgi:hypothetical protein